ncbi:MAG: helix-turn-helix transcriptional regulator [Lachnospiraceae bacterium]|nr:helix-turn-helix transcriptional regulator [Lachnospiraceae bacterium]
MGAHLKQEEENYNAEIGARLRKLRKEKSLLIKDICDELKCSVNFLSMVERGETGLTAYKAKRVSQILDCDCNSLLGVDAKGSEEEEILKLLSSMDSGEKKKVLEMVRLMSK